jgi:diaminopimelate epimerase
MSIRAETFMNKPMHYSYMHGAGNIFCVIDNREQKLSVDELSAFIVSGLPIDWNVDGLIALRDSDTYDMEVDFLNPDGSHGAMCGNGARCAVKFYVQHFLNPIPHYGDVSFSMAGTEYEAEFVDFGNHVTIYFPETQSITPITLPNALEAFYIENGADHVVIDAMQYVSNEREFEEFDLHSFAKPIRHAEQFPRGANVNLVFPKEGNRLRIRTFERGVERETAACGTGALAVGFAYASKSGQNGLSGGPYMYPIEIEVCSGEILLIHSKKRIDSISLSGPAEFLTEQEAYKLFLMNQKRMQ